MLLAVMVLAMAMLDVAGVGSIMPFMTVLLDPQLVETNTTLATIYTKLEFKNKRSFLFFLGLMVFILLVISMVYKALTTYAHTRFIMMREYSIGRRLVEGYLHQPYAWFLNRHSADLGKTVLSEVGQVVNGAMVPMMSLFAQGALMLAIISLLMFINPVLALIAGAVLGLSYGLVFKLVSGYLSRIGSERLAANQVRFTMLTEVFGAVKEVKVGGHEQAYLRRFRQSAETYAKHSASGAVAVVLPRFGLEAVAFGGMLLLVLVLITSNGDLATTLPLIALYTFSGYRLIPAVQQIYASFAQLRLSAPALDSLHADLSGLTPELPANPHAAPMKLAHGLELKGISFTYPKAQKPVLQDFNLSIGARSTIGLVGVTGSGKTTIADLILGLFEPQKGHLKVDGIQIGADNRRKWQRAIGYVPQQIYLVDDTVAANIAFGLEPDEIDQAAVERASRIANLHGFVVNELPQGYATAVGERGVRLSGGQRQRIGIARALYHSPQVLVLDEATSALDNLTEQAVMEAVRNLGHEMTIILIAHRLTTMCECDRICLLNNGRITAQGTFAELAEGNETFRAMTGTDVQPGHL